MRQTKLNSSVRNSVILEKDCDELQSFEQLKAALMHAFAAPEESYQTLTKAQFLARNLSNPKNA